MTRFEFNSHLKCRLFVDRGGVELLLQLYNLPALPSTFGSTNGSNYLTQALRMVVVPSQLAHVGPLLQSSLLRQLDMAKQVRCAHTFVCERVARKEVLRVSL
jgi:hypothetical protein